MDGACRARHIPARGRRRFTPVSASRPLAAPRARPSITRLPSFCPRVGISAPSLRRIPPLLVSSSSCFLLPVCFWCSLPFLPETQMLSLHLRVLDSQTNGGDAPGFLLLFYKRSCIQDRSCPCSINSSQVLISFSERREFFRQVKGKGNETSFLNL